jgi:hypothetical protein
MDHMGTDRIGWNLDPDVGQRFDQGLLGSAQAQ